MTINEIITIGSLIVTFVALLINLGIVIYNIVKYGE